MEAETAKAQQNRPGALKLGTMILLLVDIVVGVIVAVQYEIRTDLSASSWQAMLNIGLLILCLVLLKVRGKVSLVLGLGLGVLAYYLFQYVLPYIRG